MISLSTSSLTFLILSVATSESLSKYGSDGVKGGGRKNGSAKGERRVVKCGGVGRLGGAPYDSEEGRWEMSNG